MRGSTSCSPAVAAAARFFSSLRRYLHTQRRGDVSSSSSGGRTSTSSTGTSISIVITISISISISSSTHLRTASSALLSRTSSGSQSSQRCE